MPTLTPSDARANLYRLIDQAAVGKDFVITRLRQLDDAPAFALPPNMADAALQSSLGFVLRQDTGQIPLQVPVKIDTIDIYAPLPREVVVVAEQANDLGRQVTNIALCGQDGTVLVDFRGFVTARVGMAPPQTETARTAPHKARRPASSIFRYSTLLSICTCLFFRPVR